MGIFQSKLTYYNYPIKLTPIFFHKNGQSGDVLYELNLPENNNTLFIFNDNDTRLYGNGGNALLLREFDHFHQKSINNIRSAGIPTGNLNYGGFQSLNDYTISFMNNKSGLQITAREIIDLAMIDILELLKTNKFNQVKYVGHSNYYGEWIDLPNVLGTGTFCIGNDVNEYIIQQLKQTVSDANKSLYFQH